MNNLKLILALAFIWLFSTNCPAMQSSSNQLLEKAWQGIKTGYYSPTFDAQKWQRLHEKVTAQNYSSPAEAYTAIQSLLAQLNDPAIRFLTPEQTADFVKEVSGSPNVGVGLAEMLSIDVNEKTGKLTVVTPIPNTPAALAGIKPDDVVTAIDNTTTENMSLAEAVSRLRGVEGTTVQITVQRDGKFSNIILRRNLISALKTSVESRITEIDGKKIGYIFIYQFTQTAGKEARQAVIDLIAEGASAFVLDLRNNPGGSMTAAQETAGIFLGSKPIALVADNTGRSPLSATGKQLTDKPVAVIINEGTASAAEVVAVGLQSNKRVKIIGTKTFGKALVHGLISLPDNSAIVNTIAQILTLEDRKIRGEGITPDILSKMEESPILNPGKIVAASKHDKQFIAAIKTL